MKYLYLFTIFMSLCAILKCSNPQNNSITTIDTTSNNCDKNKVINIKLIHKTMIDTIIEEVAIKIIWWYPDMTNITKPYNSNKLQDSEYITVSYNRDNVLLQDTVHYGCGIFDEKTYKMENSIIIYKNGKFANIHKIYKVLPNVYIYGLPMISGAVFLYAFTIENNKIKLWQRFNGKCEDICANCYCYIYDESLYFYEKKHNKLVTISYPEWFPDTDSTIVYINKYHITSKGFKHEKTLGITAEQAYGTENIESLSIDKYRKDNLRMFKRIGK